MNPVPDPAITDDNRHGRIVTFYSYKGGTGRSMALANVAWILASHGKRVIVIDWDLEAPGIHRYFHPFLRDKELTSSPGIIDFVIDFAEAARREALRPEQERNTAWFHPLANLRRYAISLDWDFPREAPERRTGTIDFVPAGQQGPSYGIRISGFNWHEFYTKLGGGTFLEAVKQRLRRDYDYILIDSRTGLSDTAGICTVQMPDELVVCFTLNHQSIAGASATAAAAHGQRIKPNSEPGLRIWPVATRVDSGEKEKLETRLGIALRTFEFYLGRLNKAQQEKYWEQTQVPYQTYFAYEEVLAVFDRQRRSGSVLASMEAITSYITEGEIEKLAPINFEQRELVLSEYGRVQTEDTASATSGERRPRFFLSYMHRTSAALAEAITLQIESLFGRERVSNDSTVIEGDWKSALSKGMREADIILLIIGPLWDPSESMLRKLSSALHQGKRIVPILTGGARLKDLPDELANIQAVVLGPDYMATGLKFLMESLQRLVEHWTPASQLNPDDPQKGRWGGQSEAQNRKLTAVVSPITDDWFEIVLTVNSNELNHPLTGMVTFHLHPTFPRSKRKVQARDGVATLKLGAWGAFTVGALVEDDGTMLELDLSTLPDAPKKFRER